MNESTIHLPAFVTKMAVQMGLEVADDLAGSSFTVVESERVRRANVVGMVGEVGFTRLTGSQHVHKRGQADPGYDAVFKSSDGRSLTVDVKAVESASHCLVVNRWAKKGACDKFALVLVDLHEDGTSTVMLRGWAWNHEVFNRPPSTLPGRKWEDRSHNVPVGDLWQPNTVGAFE